MLDFWKHFTYSWVLQLVLKQLVDQQKCNQQKHKSELFTGSTSSNMKILYFSVSQWVILSNYDNKVFVDILFFMNSTN